MLTAAPGSTVTGTLRSTAHLWIRFFDPASSALLDSAYVTHESVGRITVPASGTIRMRVAQYNDCYRPWECPPSDTGAYTFVITELNRAPETGPAVFAPGDTVTGTIDPAGDVDEFTFEAVQGDTVDVSFNTPRGVWGAWADPMRLILVDLTTGTSLGTLESMNPAEHLADNMLSRIVLPSTGRYQIRVEGTNPKYSEADYIFLVKRSGS
jgi:hypothetical protein